MYACQCTQMHMYIYVQVSIECSSRHISRCRRIDGDRARGMCETAVKRAFGLSPSDPQCAHGASNEQCPFLFSTTSTRVSGEMLNRFLFDVPSLSMHEKPISLLLCFRAIQSHSCGPAHALPQLQSGVSQTSHVVKVVQARNACGVGPPWE